MPLQQFFNKHQLLSLINIASQRRASNEIYPWEEKKKKSIGNLLPLYKKYVCCNTSMWHGIYEMCTSSRICDLHQSLYPYVWSCENTWMWDIRRPLLSLLKRHQLEKRSRNAGLADGSESFWKAMALNEPQATPEAGTQLSLHMWPARKGIKWIKVNSEPSHLLSCAYFMEQNRHSCVQKGLWLEPV